MAWGFNLFWKYFWYDARVVCNKVGSIIGEIGLKIGLEEFDQNSKSITSEVLLDPLILWSSILRLMVEIGPISVDWDIIVCLARKP